MSGRGGRGGRGGGRGGSRGKPAPPGMPGGDDPSLIVNDQPQETYPKFYKPPVAPHLSPLEERAVAYFVNFRRAYHKTPLYTHRHINGEFLSVKDPVLPRHGQSQINARYGLKNRATVDPFLSVPMYSHRFVDDTRTLPKLRDVRPWVKDMFPEELWATLDGRDTSGSKGGFRTKGNANRGTKRRLHDDDDEEDPYGDGDDDEEIFGWGRSQRRRENETEEERKARIEGTGKDADNEDADGGDPDDEDEEEMEVEDDDYESAEEEEGGDYNAEAYFDNGDDDDFGDDDGIGESAMDF
ncbi:hypothetical protein F5Y09DRAFT_326888 [Xylaria sp. FL1042]|nr:hypothetical protein F5Y09DRAFT_326888 [Xylaria sp. FL1042]